MLKRCCNDISQIKRLAWMVIFSNALASFTVGLTIAGSIHYSLADVNNHIDRVAKLKLKKILGNPRKS